MGVGFAVAYRNDEGTGADKTLMKAKKIVMKFREYYMLHESG